MGFIGGSMNPVGFRGTGQSGMDIYNVFCLKLYKIFKKSKFRPQKWIRRQKLPIW